MVSPGYLKGVHRANKTLNLRTNAGTSLTNKRGYFQSFPFRLNPLGITNVVLLRLLKSRYRVMYDSASNGGAFIVDIDSGNIVFEQ